LVCKIYLSLIRSEPLARYRNSTTDTSRLPETGSPLVQQVSKECVSSIAPTNLNLRLLVLPSFLVNSRATSPQSVMDIFSDEEDLP
jgi:hypothetical protein